MINDIKLKGLVDMTLTPENAISRGYKYLDDVEYHAFIKSDSINNLLQFAKDNGFKLGIPSPRNDFENFYGLYAPRQIKKVEN
jgi:hypothetical protein